MKKELKCIIVDDEPLAVSLLESFVRKTPGVELLASFTDSVEAVEAIKTLGADLVFLDIQMPDLDGMELGRMVPPDTRIVYTTAFKEYAFDSYEVSALDFLLKPIRYNKFLSAIEKAQRWLQPTPVRADLPSDRSKEAGPSTLFIRVDGELRQVPLSRILYVKGMKDYVIFYLEGERRGLITHLTMKSVEEMLPADRFLRVHRSYIVSLEGIAKVDRNDCIYIGDEIIHVTEAFAEPFHRWLTAHVPQS